MNLRRVVWRQFLKLRFHLFQRHRHDRLALETVAGRPFLILPQVFNPTLFLTSEFLVHSLDERLIPADSRVLDMGTGSGVAAVFAAQWAAEVMALDINPMAVRCARINALLNGVECRVRVEESDLFAAVAGQRFDVILFNPPYFKGTPRNALDRAFRADDVIERFAADLKIHLRPEGWGLLLLSSEAAVIGILQRFEQEGFAHYLLAQRDMVSESVYLFQLQTNGIASG
jgi:release factor glutamine methyltransferase